jgi:hypothetical protein
MHLRSWGRRRSCCSRCGSGGGGDKKFSNAGIICTAVLAVGGWREGSQVTAMFRSVVVGIIQAVLLKVLRETHTNIAQVKVIHRFHFNRMLSS